MHISSINFISFTAQIYNALHMQGKRHLGGMALWSPLNPPMNSREILDPLSVRVRTENVQSFSRPT